MNLRAHDLLCIDIESIVREPNCPAWVQIALEQMPWVVVRRAIADNNDAVPIGVRGLSRQYRFATNIPLNAIKEIIHPEDLVYRIHDECATSDLPALTVLPALARQLRAQTWGPTGSVGFYLATAAPVITSTSDLDLILRYEDLPRRLEAAKLLTDIETLEAKADVLLELPQGALSLHEYVYTEGPILLRRDRGPLLINPAALSAPPQETAS